MEGCLAPSEIPNISTADASVFGAVAENIIYADFRSKQFYPPYSIYVDDYNEGSYLYFLARHNSHFSESRQLALYSSLRITKLGVRRPDILTHTFMRKEFYEIKPDSVSGMEEGVRKVGTLSATYIAFSLPYKPGVSYKPENIVVASFANQLKIHLKVSLRGPGLVTYKLCLESSRILDVLTLSALLRYVVKKSNEQKGFPTFRPVDLRPAFIREGELATLAKALGLTMVVVAAGTIGWKFFWKAVAKRFAARGATAAFLTAADGPLPIGDLIAAGMSLWTVFDIIRFSDELWREAGQIALQEA